MRRRVAWVCWMAILATPGLAYPQPQAGPPPGALVARIDTTKAGRAVSRYEYGMFIEHLGQLVYRSLWAEMLDDRKFYFPVSTADDVSEAPRRRGPPFISPLRKWRPVGADSFVTLDSEQPFVGEHDLQVRLEPDSPHGIRQTGLTLTRGRQYTGYIVLRGSPTARVSVRLTWGDSGGERVTLSELSATYRKFPLSFTSTADTRDAALEITATGSGELHVGTVSLMPADNVRGFRREVIEALRPLHSGLWRLPGGNFISDFNWYDSIGDRDTRPPVFDDAWNAVQSNDVGLDEFMTFCELLGVDPYITVNAGFGDAHSAAEEVEYMNGATSTRLGALRAANGHAEPYHVKFWNIGNEPYGTWQLGRTDLKYYILKHNAFARAMRRADPSITLLASGAMPDEMTIEGIAREMHLENDQVELCSEADWTCGLIQHSLGYFDGITEHWYTRAGVHFDVTRQRTAPRLPGLEAGYVPVQQSVLEWVRQPANRVRLKAEEWAQYQERFPALERQGIFLSIDEYAYTGRPPDLQLALAYGMVLNEMLRHTGFLRMSAFTMGVSTLDIDPASAVLNTNGLLFRLYGEHLGEGALPVTVSGNSPPPRLTWPVLGDQPRTPAGSPTDPLDVVAALSADRKYLTVAVVNATDSGQPLRLEVSGVRVGAQARRWRLTGPKLEAANHVGEPPQVRVEESEIRGRMRTLSIAPISIEMYQFPVAR